jgi:ribosome maturation factor RimP
MSLKDQLEKITELAEQVASQLGLVLVDVRFSQAGKRRSVEVTIYRRGGRIKLEDCEAVSRSMEDALDKQTPPLLEGAYLLEVQSPGIDRQLATEREFTVFNSQPVEVLAKEKIDALGTLFSGTLSSASAGKVVISNPKAIASGSKSKAKAKSNLIALDTPAQIELEISQLIYIKLAPAELVEHEKSMQETN